MRIGWQRGLEVGTHGALGLRVLDLFLIRHSSRSEVGMEETRNKVVQTKAAFSGQFTVVHLLCINYLMFEKV